jgi:hypothetical protein
MGKTVTTEYAYFQHGKNTNPQDAGRTPGGSSSGSAAAVAAHMVPGAGGSQTNGSVIRPAAFCGVVGFKPTHGLIPRSGVLLLSRTLDHVGVFARTVADVAAVRLAYETGRLTNGGGGLATIPVIDFRGYSDDAKNGDIHVRYHSFSIRERLRKANGRTDNHIMLVTDSRHGLYGTRNPVLVDALRQMDRARSQVPLYVYVDEVYSLAYLGLVEALNKLRDAHISLLLSHQDLSDLERVSPEFARGVWGNTRNKIVLYQSDDEL